jgi:epoxyqueuosine reductase QueG
VNTKSFLENARSRGAALAGVADLAGLADLPTRPPDLFSGFTRAVVLAVRLADPILDGIEDTPTPLYSQHYQRVNALLDELATRTAQDLTLDGHRAVPLPASQTLDRENHVSYVSHKALALAAGLGWQGKSLLLVTPEHGPRVRLVSLLTDAGLTAGRPVKNRCGSCTFCVEACPVGAIRGVNTEYHYESRQEALDFDSCADNCHSNEKMEHIAGPVCGVCVRACPWGKKKKKK